MSAIERQISITRGPFFFDDPETGELCFQFAADNSTIIGPMLAKDAHIIEYPDAHRVYLQAKAAGENPEPEFVQRERRHKKPEPGVSVFDMGTGHEDENNIQAPDKYVPGETAHPNVGPGGRKAGPEPEPAEPEVEPAIAEPAETATIEPEARGRGRPRKQ